MFSADEMESSCCYQAVSLANMSQDVLLLVGEACSDPLAPKALAYLAATSCQMLTVLCRKLNELRDLRAELRALCSKELSDTQASSLAEVQRLEWYGRDFTPAELTVLGQLLHSGALLHLRELALGRSQIGGEGFAAFVQALDKEALGNLQKLALHENRIDYDGMKAFLATIASGALGSLTFLGLGHNQISDAGMIALSGAIGNSNRSLGKLTTLYLFNNEIGNAGMIAFAKALRHNINHPTRGRKGDALGDAGPTDRY